MNHLITLISVINLDYLIKTSGYNFNKFLNKITKKRYIEYNNLLLYSIKNCR